jgi:penicillin-insensitive murein DD-endopeptidase
VNSRRLALALPLFLGGCFASPTPLAPGVNGSVGAPHHGVLTDGVELPKRGKGYMRLRPHSPRYWGSPGLVETIETAAAEVEEHYGNGAPLSVGDLSARYGGEIQGHRSHRTGRDVDLLFYVTTPSGIPVQSPGFVHFSSDALAPVPGTEDYVRLDVPRQWQLVKSLLRSEAAGIQLIFVSREVEALIIDHALATERDLELVWRAETVLIEPSDSTPHDDHLHVRVACRPEQLVMGCEGGGPYWDWLPVEAPWIGLDAVVQWLGNDDPPTPLLVPGDGA